MQRAALVALAAAGLTFAAAGGASRADTPPFPAPDCPATIHGGAGMLTPSLLSDATHTSKRYEAGGDTHGGEVGCNYYDNVKSSNYGWTLYYLFATDKRADVTAEVDGGFGPLGGWAHPDPAYCGVSKTAYAYVDCNTTDAETVADAKAMLTAAESMSAQQAAPTTTTTAKNPTRTASISKASGDVEFSTDGGKTFAALTPTTVLHDGDFVSTGFESKVTLTFGYGTLTIAQLTQFRIDEFIDSANIQTTQMYLRVGSVAAKEAHHAASIRSDFSVVTPTCNSSIRGSGMVVSISKAGVTSVFTTSDVSYVKGLADKKATTVKSGFMTTVGKSKKAQRPVRYTAAALKAITG